MSAIYGIVTEKRLSDVEASIHFLKRQYDERYQGDRSGVWKDRGVAVGALEQWISSEEKRTPQPYSFGDAFVVVADAMLDYREELAEKLGITLTNQTDVELIALAYNLWGQDCVREFYGPFAIAVYDRRTNEVVLFRDRFGERSICYIEHEGAFAFSTIPKPLARLFNRPVNEAFIQNYVAIPFEVAGYNRYSAQWEDIFYVPPGHVGVWNGASVTLSAFWKYEVRESSPMEKSEEAYFQEFRELMEGAVKQSIRTDGKVGIMLSSGLDSATVAAFAEPLLKKEDKTLHAFTHVPVDEYTDTEKIFGNERPLVEDLIKQYDGIQPNWIQNKELNAFNTIDKWLDVLDMPYIFLVNGPWLYALMDEAGQQGIKVMLSGKQGNFSISYGKSHHYYNHLVLSLKLNVLFKEVMSFKKESNQSIYRSLRMLAGSVYQSQKTRNNSIRTMEEYAKEFFAKEFRHSLSIERWFSRFKNFKDGMHTMYSTDELHNRGVVNSLWSLHFNYVQRDPTLDFKIINFLQGLPNEMFAVKRKSKRLIREGLAGRLPSSILNPSRKKGTQSADWDVRMRRMDEELLAHLRALKSSKVRHFYHEQLFEEKVIKRNLKVLWNCNNLLKAVTLDRFFGGEENEKRMGETSYGRVTGTTNEFRGSS